VSPTTGGIFKETFFVADNGRHLCLFQSSRRHRIRSG